MKVLKADLDIDDERPFRLYTNLFQKKGRAQLTIYKIYTLGLLWMSLSFALLGMDTINPSFYLNQQLHMSDEDAQSVTQLLDMPLKASSSIFYVISILVLLAILIWHSTRSQIYSKFHYVTMSLSMCGLVLGVVVEFICLIAFNQVVSSQSEHLSIVKVVERNVASIATIRVWYGVAFSLHELCAYKLILQLNESVGSFGGLMIAFGLTSRCFKYAFLQMLSMNDWINYGDACFYVMIFGLFAVLFVVSFVFLEVNQYLQLHHGGVIQEKELTKLKRKNGQRVWKFHMVNYGNLLIVGFVLLMAICFYFGVLSVPLGLGGGYWSQYTNAGVKDLIGLRVTINYLIMVSLPFFGACFDHGGLDESEKKRKYRIRKLKKEPLLKFSATRFRLWLLCGGMIVAISTCYFYIMENPTQVAMYNVALNVVTFFHSLGISLSMGGIFLIPIYIFSKTTKLEIETKARILKKNYSNRIQYLYYLHSIFFEQREMSGIRYALWFSIVSLVSNLGHFVKMGFDPSSVIISSIAIYTLSAIAIVTNSIYHLIKSRRKKRNRSTSDPIYEDKSTSKFDTSSFFVKNSIQGPIKRIISILTWPIDLLLSLNMIIFVSVLAGVPTVACYIFEKSFLDPETHSTHPIVAAFLPVLFLCFNFTFRFVYPSHYNRFTTMHLFRWVRGINVFDSLHQSPISCIKNDSNFSYSLSKYAHELDELTVVGNKLISRTIKNTVWTNSSNQEVELQNDTDLYYEISDINSDPSTTKDECEKFHVITVKDDRTYIAEEKLMDNSERVIIQHFTNREDYLNYFRSESFIDSYNERDYYHAALPNATVLFKKSKFKNTYMDVHALQLLHKYRISQKTVVKVMGYYLGLYIISIFFSWIDLAPIPVITNPFTFLIDACNFVFGFLMFFPLIAVWLDINHSITSTLKEVIVLLQDTREKLKLFSEKDFITYDPTRQVKINISNNRFYLFDHDMLKEWFKKINFLQKTLMAKTGMLKNNFIFAFVLTKAGSVLLSLISLFTNIELNTQNFQPMYIVFGLDMSVLFLIIGPCAIIYHFMGEIVTTMMKMRVKVDNALEMYPQDSKEAIKKFSAYFNYIEALNKLKGVSSEELGCSFEVHDHIRVVLDSSMNKAWFYSFLATLPPAILKLVIQKFFTSSGHWQNSVN